MFAINVAKFPHTVDMIPELDDVPFVRPFEHPRRDLFDVLLVVMPIAFARDVIILRRSAVPSAFIADDVKGAIVDALKFRSDTAEVDSESPRDTVVFVFQLMIAPLY